MKKKIRYSDLAAPAPAPLTKFTPASNVAVPQAAPDAPVAPAEPKPKPKASKPKTARADAPNAEAVSAEAVNAGTPKAVDPATVAETAAPRPRRDSAPVELARALQQARAAEAARAAETLAHVEARAAAAHARGLAEAEAAAMADTMAAPASIEGDGETKKPFVYARMAPPDEAELEDDAPELRGPRRPLRERARGRSGNAELLMFRIGAERFAVELICVEEAIDLPDVHHVPEMPPAMLGVITVRETLTPVFTPDEALGVPVQGRGAALIFRSERGRFALAIDDVDDVMTLDLATLRDAPGSDVADAVVLGVARIGDAIVALVDADALVVACQALPVLELA
ncbi:MAG TPA: chemotaxis protein CheW [Gemmatimonadaceae bacterium]|nr:chemotaxis protein CheW [Gemmatimonadaceae bacterium]